MKTNASLGIAMLTGLALAAGCASTGPRHAYEGSPRDPSELATVRGTTNSASGAFNPRVDRLSFTRVDGDRTVPWYSPESYPSVIYIAPGKRKVDVAYEYIHGVANSPVWIDARTNHTYQVKVMTTEGRTERVYFVVEDVTAQTLVGGTEEKTGE